MEHKTPFNPLVLERRVEKRARTLWEESTPIAKSFALGVLSLNIPQSAKIAIIPDAVAIGDALYQTTVFDYGTTPNGLGLFRLSARRPSGRPKYSAYVLDTVSGFIKESHLGNSCVVHGYLSEFYNQPEVQARLSRRTNRTQVAA